MRCDGCHSPDVDELDEAGRAACAVCAAEARGWRDCRRHGAEEALETALAGAVDVLGIDGALEIVARFASRAD